MLKSTKVYLLSLATTVSAISFVSPPAFAQMEGDEEIDVVINIPDAGPGGMDFPDMAPPPPGAEEGLGMAFNLPVPPPPDMGAMGMRMRGPGMGRGFGGGGCPIMGGCSPLGMLSGENAVTDEQYEKLYDLKNRSLDQVGPKMLELFTASRHLRDVLTQETIDEKAAKKLQSQITGLKADLEGIKLSSKMEMMQILTGAQRKELRQAMIKGPRATRGHMMMKRFHEKRKEHDGK